MSIQTCIKQAASEKLGPLASAIILNGDFSQGGSFDPYFEMLTEELAEVQTAANFYLQQERANMLRLDLEVAEGARFFVLMIQTAYVDIAPAATLQGVKLVVPPSTPAVPIASGPVVATVTLFQPEPNPSGSNSCFARGCGQKFTTFHEAMAHKVLAHSYNQGRWTIGWARDFMASYGGSKVPVSAAVASPTTPDEDEDRSNPSLQTVSTGWVPKLNLDLTGLGLAAGEASRFAVGDKDDARFYYIKRLKIGTTIKGKFVWTKFAHRFYSETVHPDDFVVRKMAGDTKEWIGMQRKHGVWNPKFDQNTPSSERFIHKGIFVGDHEADIEAILADPYEARVRYGRLIGSCGYCGRKLTDPESRARGIGPDCWEAKGLPAFYAHVRAKRTAAGL